MMLWFIGITYMAYDPNSDQMAFIMNGVRTMLGSTVGDYGFKWRFNIFETQKYFPSSDF